MLLVTLPGVPESTQQGVKFINAVRAQKGSLLYPALVHCSAGVGRTGSIIALDIGIDLYLAGKEVPAPLPHCLSHGAQVDMIEVMRKMREDRGGAIQSEDQLEYAYHCLIRWIRNHKQARRTPAARPLTRAAHGADGGRSQHQAGAA